MKSNAAWAVPRWFAAYAQEFALGQPIDDQRGRWRREEHLSAVSCGHDAGRAVHGLTVVVLAIASGLADVQAHAHE